MYAYFISYEYLYNLGLCILIVNIFQIVKLLVSFSDYNMTMQWHFGFKIR